MPNLNALECSFLAVLFLLLTLSASPAFSFGCAVVAISWALTAMGLVWGRVMPSFELEVCYA